VLAIELAVAIFIVAPVGVLTPRSGLVPPLFLTALVVTPVLLAAVLVASTSGAARAAVFVSIALIVTGIVLGFQGPSVAGTYLHLIGSLLLGGALIWVVARAVFAPGRVTTVGYSDVVPTHPLTRGLSNLETVVGPLFPATLIARMVTLELTARHGGAGLDDASPPSSPSSPWPRVTAGGSGTRTSRR